jgi:hypothetical protein
MFFQSVLAKISPVHEFEVVDFQCKPKLQSTQLFGSAELFTRVLPRFEFKVSRFGQVFKFHLVPNFGLSLFVQIESALIKYA